LNCRVGKHGCLREKALSPEWKIESMDYLGEGINAASLSVDNDTSCADLQKFTRGAI